MRSAALPDSSNGWPPTAQSTGSRSLMPQTVHLDNSIPYRLSTLLWFSVSSPFSTISLWLDVACLLRISMNILYTCSMCSRSWTDSPILQDSEELKSESSSMFGSAGSPAAGPGQWFPHGTDSETTLRYAIICIHILYNI